MPLAARSTLRRSALSRGRMLPGSRTRTSTSTEARRRESSRLRCVERVIAGRGGYCFHLNGALVTLLEWLQVDVTRHVSGVQGGAGEAPGPNGNHLGITARLPDGSEWFVDAGLGDGPVDPLPLVFGTYEQSGFTYELRPSSFDPQGWRLEHDPRGAFIGADFAAAPARTEQFLEMHQRALDVPDVRLRPDRGCHAPHRRGRRSPPRLRAHDDDERRHRERRRRLRGGLVGDRDRRVRPRATATFRPRSAHRVWANGAQRPRRHGTPPAGVDRNLRPAARYFRSPRISEAARSPDSTAPLRYPCESCEVCSPAKWQFPERSPSTPANARVLADLPVRVRAPGPLIPGPVIERGLAVPLRRRAGQNGLDLAEERLSLSTSACRSRSSRRSSLRCSRRGCPTCRPGRVRPPRCSDSRESEYVSPFDPRSAQNRCLNWRCSFEFVPIPSSRIALRLDRAEPGLRRVDESQGRERQCEHDVIDGHRRRSEPARNVSL